jgi:hypothetical protein
MNTEMNEQQYERTMIAMALITLKQFENHELAAFNLAVQLYGRVQPENLAFKQAVDFKLIKEDGSLWDAETLKTACEIEVNERHARGDF